MDVVNFLLLTAGQCYCMCWNSPYGAYGDGICPFSVSLDAFQSLRLEMRLRWIARGIQKEHYVRTRQALPTWNVASLAAGWSAWAALTAMLCERHDLVVREGYSFRQHCLCVGLCTDGEC